MGQKLSLSSKAALHSAQRVLRSVRASLLSTTAARSASGSLKIARKIFASRTQIPCPISVIKPIANNMGIKISIGLSPGNSGQWVVGSGEIKTAHCPLSLCCLQSNSVSRQLSMRFNARHNLFSIHEGASSKRQATRSGARRKERSLNLRNYTAGELSKAEFLWQFIIRHKPNGPAW
jgi:hypothetical protein